MQVGLRLYPIFPMYGPQKCYKNAIFISLCNFYHKKTTQFTYKIEEILAQYM